MKNYTDLKTFEDACKVLVLDPNKVNPDFSCYPEKHKVSMIAYAKIVIIVEAANKLANDGKEWIADFTDRSQYKYEAWFYVPEGSSAFRYDGFDRWPTGSLVGSRLCFISSGVCEYIANQYIETFNDWLL